MSLDSLGDDWVVWNDEREKVILAFRPDVFDGDAFPAPCLPTIHVTRGRRGRRPGQERVGVDWYVTLYLEPEVHTESESYGDRESALGAAVDLANGFASADVDYRDLYQVPRPEFLDRLDELTGGTDAEPQP